MKLLTNPYVLLAAGVSLLGLLGATATLAYSVGHDAGSGGSAAALAQCLLGTAQAATQAAQEASLAQQEELGRKDARLALYAAETAAYAATEATLRSDLATARARVQTLRSNPDAQRLLDTDITFLRGVRNRAGEAAPATDRHHENGVPRAATGTPAGVRKADH